jgi:uncharacterized protein YndB with AHSA1/START domain
MVREQINVAASPRAVWRAFTTPEGLSGWWADEARVDAREGGRLVLTQEGDEGPVQEGAIFLSLRPIRRIEIRFDRARPTPLARGP